MEAHYLVIGLILVLFSAGCIQSVSHDSYDPREISPIYETNIITEFPSDNAPSLRDIFFYWFSKEDNPANYTSFCPPSYVPADYSPYSLFIYTEWNETEPDDHRTTVCEKLAYGLNITPHASWNPEMMLLEVSWSEHGYNPYEKNEILSEDPKSVDINGITGWIYEIEQTRLIVWTAGNATYQVYGSPDREELLRVARSIVCGEGDIGVVSDV